MLEDIKGIKSGKKELREFGLTVGAILVILGVVALWRGKNVYPYFLSIGIALIVPVFWAPRILLPLQKAWMALALIIGFFMSRIILAALFYFVITPIGILTKIFRKDILDERIDRRASSYWRTSSTQTKTKDSYHNQY
jgi:multisubunit Na+/H+ antiporter MnhG subunit